MRNFQNYKHVVTLQKAEKIWTSIRAMGNVIFRVHMAVLRRLLFSGIRNGTVLLTFPLTITYGYKFDDKAWRFDTAINISQFRATCLKSTQHFYVYRRQYNDRPWTIQPPSGVHPIITCSQLGVCVVEEREKDFATISFHLPQAMLPLQPVLPETTLQWLTTKCCFDKNAIFFYMSKA